MHYWYAVIQFACRWSNIKKKKIVKFEENLDTNIFTFLCIKKSIGTPDSHAQPVTMGSHNNGI